MGDAGVEPKTISLLNAEGTAGTSPAPLPPNRDTLSHGINPRTGAPGSGSFLSLVGPQLTGARHQVPGTQPRPLASSQAFS